MRKPKRFMIALIMIAIALVGCGTGDGISQESNQNKSVEESSESKDEGSKGTNEEDMSQAEWMESVGADNMEDGYEKVEKINIDSSDTKLSYEKSEKYTLENGEDVILVYFNFSNVSAEQTSIDAQYNFSAFQNGVEITVYSTIWDEFEAAQNRDKQILPGATIEVAIAVVPDDWESSIKLRVNDEMLYDEGERIYTFQQQEIALQ